MEDSFRLLGRAMFNAVFRSSEEASGYYTAASTEGLANYTLSIVSDDPSFLTLPWELLNEPNAGYLALRFSSLVRQVNRQPSEFHGALPTEQLNVLLVSPAPLGPYATSGLAWEAMEVLDSLEVHAALDCIRPPTLAVLSQHLSDTRNYYHLVLLDGFPCDATGSLLFESADGGGEPAPAAKVSEALAGAGVPIVMLTAASTPDVDLPPGWAAAATILASNGVPQVVSLPFPLPSPGGQLFLQSFFRAIAQGAGAPQAVAQARQALMDEPSRYSPAGEVVFWDWIVAQVYQSQRYTPAPIVPPDSPKTGFSALPTADATQSEDQILQGGVYGLVGRRSELRHLERLFSQAPVVLLSGPTGVGKTELALGLARWSSRTRARPGGVFYSSFDVRAGVERIVHEVGTTIAGTGLCRHAGCRAAPLAGRVPSAKTHRCLYWTGWKNVSGFPTPGPRSAGRGRTVRAGTAS